MGQWITRLYSGRHSVAIILLLVACPLLAQSDPNEVEIANPTEWLESDELQIIWREMSERRWLPSEIQGQVQGTRILYKATFVPFPPDTNYFYTYWGMTNAWFKKYNDDLLEQGYQPYAHTTFYDAGGSVLNNATWVLTGDQLPLSPWEQFIEKLEAMLDSITGAI